MPLIGDQVLHLLWKLGMDQYKWPLIKCVSVCCVYFSKYHPLDSQTEAASNYTRILLLDVVWFSSKSQTSCQLRRHDERVLCPFPAILNWRLCFNSVCINSGDTTGSQVDQWCTSVDDVPTAGMYILAACILCISSARTVEVITFQAFNYA